MNPLTIVLLPFLSYGLASHALIEIRGQGLPQVLVRAVWIRALCAAILLFGIARNLPVYPFDLLAPGATLRSVQAKQVQAGQVPVGSLVLRANSDPLY